MIAAAVSAVAVAAHACHYRAGGALPDRACTPGALNRAVTQQTIRRTICRVGWTSTVRPSSWVTEPQKRESMRRYGVAGRPPGDYEFDHLVPLELGGAPDDPRNLWPEPYDAFTVDGRHYRVGAWEKDEVENELRRRVCIGQVPLRVAQRLVARDWRSALTLAWVGLAGKEPSSRDRREQW